MREERVLHPLGEIYGPNESHRRDMRPGGVPAAPPLQVGVAAATRVGTIAKDRIASLA